MWKYFSSKNKTKQNKTKQNKTKQNDFAAYLITIWNKSIIKIWAIDNQMWYDWRQFLVLNTWMNKKEKRDEYTI